MGGTSTGRNNAVYDVVAGTWTTKAIMTNGAQNPGMVCIGNYIYAGMGSDGGYTSNTWNRYDTGGNAWSTLPTPPYYHRWAEFMEFYGKIVFLHHERSISYSNTPDQVPLEAYLIDPASINFNTWVSLPGPPSPWDGYTGYNHSDGTLRINREDAKTVVIRPSNKKNNLLAYLASKI
jgi:hypothetical protein